jgi:hypothetical protein
VEFLYTISLASPEGNMNILSFEGTVKAAKGQMGKKEFAIRGASSLAVKDLHWADTNGNHRIDDEEILTLYDLLGEIKGFELDRHEVEDIWAGNGYIYDKKEKRFVIIP